MFKTMNKKMIKEVNKMRGRNDKRSLPLDSVVEICEAQTRSCGQWGGYVHIAVVAMPASHELKVIRDTHKQEVLWDSGKVYGRSSGGPDTDYGIAYAKAVEILKQHAKRG